MARITENEIAEIVIDILQDRPTGEVTIAELVAGIPKRATLTSEDLAPSPTRPGEAIWEQQVRNITSHKASPGNAIHDGKLIALPGGFRLPEKVV